MRRSQTIFCAILVKTGKDNYYHFYEAHFKNKTLGHYDTFATNIGLKSLAVRGHDNLSFYNSVIDSKLGKIDPKIGQPSFKDNTLPALVLCNRLPSEIDESSTKQINPKDINLVIFSADFLEKVDNSGKDALVNFMRQLSSSINSNTTNKFVDEQQWKTSWYWLNQYVEFKPSFFGIKPDIFGVIGDILHLRFDK
ncbi:hypothetical protein [Nostoc sp.]|uniref:hypothetical protein n=1 Tax=Nostoc sp. TaxID=1180 RepID=UPI002FF7CAD0